MWCNELLHILRLVGQQWTRRLRRGLRSHRHIACCWTAHQSIVAWWHLSTGIHRLHAFTPVQHTHTAGQQDRMAIKWRLHVYEAKEYKIRSHTRLLQPKKHDITTTNDIWSHQNKQARWPLQHAVLLNNHRVRIILLKWIISAGEMYSMTCVEWAGDMVLVWCKLMHFWRRYTQKKLFLHYLFPVTLTYDL